MWITTVLIFSRIFLILHFSDVVFYCFTALIFTFLSWKYRFISFQMTRVMKEVTIILNLPYSTTSNFQRSLIQYYEKTIETTTEWSTMRNSSQRKSGLNEAKNRWYKSRFKTMKILKIISASLHSRSWAFQTTKITRACNLFIEMV